MNKRTAILDKNYETNWGFRKTGVAFTFSPPPISQCWPNGMELFPYYSTLIQRGRGGQLLFCEAEVKELLTLPIVFWLSHFFCPRLWYSFLVSRNDFVNFCSSPQFSDNAFKWIKPRDVLRYLRRCQLQRKTMIQHQSREFLFNSWNASPETR